jgi:hypothetical protein
MEVTRKETARSGKLGWQDALMAHHALHDGDSEVKWLQSI